MHKYPNVVTRMSLGEGGLIKKLRVFALKYFDDFLLDLDNEDQTDSEEMLGQLAMLF